MPFIVQRSAQCPTSKPYGVFTEVGGHGTGKTGNLHGCHPTAAAARKQQAALYANVPEASRSVAPPPPNLREAEPTSAERCGSCKMYDAAKSVCWGYGNTFVEPHEVCDSYSPEPATQEANSSEVPMTATVATPHTIEWRRDRARSLSESQRKRTETRQVHEPLELREAGDGTGNRVLRSYASLFDEPYTVRTAGYRFEETVKPGAFKRTLGTNPDVVFRYDHSGPPLARTSSGTLRLGEDKKGLWYEADLNPSDPDVMALIPKIERGDLSESSFAFRVGHNGDKWNDEHDKRDILACELDRGDVSVVTFGASRVTGQHMLLRSEEAMVALQEMGFERLLEAFVEWRNWTLLTTEERVGRVVSSQSMETLRRVLALVSDADDAVDEAEAMLSDFLGIENPNSDPAMHKVSATGNKQSGKVTDAEQLGRVRSEERDADSPLDGDHHRTAPHLLDTVLSDLAHAQQHMGRLFESEVMKNADASQFNAEHLKSHLDGAQEHAQKLDRHLSEFASDPDVFRSEREKLSAQRAETESAEGEGERGEEDFSGIDLYDEDEDRKALTSKARDSLPETAFVFPKDRRYPIHNISHARNALARASGKPEESAVKRAVYKRYPSLKPTTRFELLPNDSDDLLTLLNLNGM